MRGAEVQLRKTELIKVKITDLMKIIPAGTLTSLIYFPRRLVLRVSTHQLKMVTEITIIQSYENISLIIPNLKNL